MKENKIANGSKINLCILGLLLLLVSGVAVGWAPECIDSSVSLKEDFFSHINGKWLNKKPGLPAQCDSNANDVKRFIQENIKSCITTKNDKYDKSVNLLYTSLRATDVSKTIKSQLSDIDHINNNQIPEIVVYLNKLGIQVFVGFVAYEDMDDDSGAEVWSARIGLDKEIANPIDDDSIIKLFKSAGETVTLEDINAIKSIETIIKNARNRNYAKKQYEIDKLPTEMKFLQGYLAKSGITTKVKTIEVYPAYLAMLDNEIWSKPIEDIRAYLKFRFLSTFKDLLEKRYLAQDGEKAAYQYTQDVFGQELYGICFAKTVQLADITIQKLAGNIRKAYVDSINSIIWMSEDTKNKLYARLALVKQIRINIPHRYGDYSQFTNDDPVHNIILINSAKYQHNLDNLGQLASTYDDWEILIEEGGLYIETAFYKHADKQITIPLADLAPPNFYELGDDAIKYGTLGFTIAHEMSHSLFDTTPRATKLILGDEAELFKAKIVDRLAKQYKDYDHETATMDEIIADDFGLMMAYKAYHLALRSKDEIKSGTTDQELKDSEQNFYRAFANTWRRGLESDKIHLSDKDRVNETLKNQPDFPKVFDIKSGPMYLSPELQVHLP